jgi:hypothetical protein
MQKQTSLKRKLFRYAPKRYVGTVLFAVWRSLFIAPVFSIRARAHRYTRGMALLVLGATLLVGLGVNLARPAQTAAATSNTVNFQARLENINGSIVPDGWYNVQFNLYNASSGGTTQWIENYTYNNGSSNCTGAPLGTGDCRIQVINGYLTANLGSITTFSGINWDQQQWITMNIDTNGTTSSGAITWNGEMTPRLKLTAVPYAFRAGQLADPANSGSTLTWATQGAARSLQLPNEAGTLCVQTSVNCGFALGTSASYIQNTSSVQLSANFNISGNGTIGTNLVVTGTSTLSGLLDVTNVAASAASTGVGVGDKISLYNNTYGFGIQPSRIVAYVPYATSGLAVREATGSGQESGGTDAVVLFGNGDITAIGKYNTNTFNSNTLQFGAAGPATIDSASGQPLQIGTSANAHNLIIGNTTGATAVTIQAGTGGVTIGTASTNVPLTLQGSAATVLTATNATGTTALGFAAPSTAGTVTFQLPAGGTGSTTYGICTTLIVCSGYGSGPGGAYIQQVPTTTAQNTIAPTVASVVGLTVKGTTGTAAHVIDIYNSNASPTLQDYFDANGSLNVGQVIQPTSNNTIDLGLSGTAFHTGYFGTSVVTPLVQAASNLTLNTAGAGTVFVGTTNSTTVSIGNATNATAVNIQGGSLNSTTVGAVDIEAAYVNSTTFGSITIGALFPSNIYIGDRGDANPSSTTYIMGGSGANAIIMSAGTTASPGTINIGGIAGDSVIIGSLNNTSAGILTFGNSVHGENINIGNGIVGTTYTNTIKIGTNGTGTGKNLITIGSQNDASQTTIQGGSGGVNIGANSTFTNNSSTVLAAQSFSVSSSTTIGPSAAATVDVATTFNVTATTGSLTLTLFNPTVATAGRLVYVSNVGSNSFIMYGVTSAPGTTQDFLWNGSAWTVNGSGTTGNYIQNGTATQIANFNIQSAAAGSIGGVIQGASGQTADLLDFKNSGGVLSGFTAAGNLQFQQAGTINIASATTGTQLTIQAGTATGSNNVGGNLLLQGGAGAGSGASGSVIVKSNGANNSTMTFQVQNTGSQDLLQVDTLNNNVVLGGNNSGELQQWQNNTNSLAQGPRADGLSVIVNGYLYFLGGVATNTDSAVSYGKINTDGSVAAMSTTAPLPQAIAGAVPITIDGRIYIVGGDDVNATQATVYYALPNVDGTISSWTTDSSSALPQARESYVGGSANGYIYVVGGRTSGSAQKSTVYYAKVNADGSIGNWSCQGISSGAGATGCGITPTNANTMPAAQDNAGGMIANGYIYVLGGSQSGGQTVYYAKLNTDGSTGAWSSSGNTLPVPLAAASTVAMNGYVYIIGGKSGSTNQSQVYYAPINSNGSLGTWTTEVNALPLPRSSLPSTVPTANGYIYIPGGNNGGYAATIYYASTERIKVGGSLDLVGLTGQNLADPGSTGGQLTAGNTYIVGTLQVQSQANFAQSVGINGNLSVTGNAAIQTANNSPTAFQVQNAAGNNVFDVDTTYSRIGINDSAPSYDLSFGQGANRTVGIETQATAATAGNNLTVNAGAGNTSGTGGQLTLTGGGGGSSGAGGAVTLEGGNAGGSNTNGGQAGVQGGSASGTGTGGAVSIQGGSAAATAGSAGGAISLVAANGTSTGTGGIGGNVTITAGNAQGSGNNIGGSITLQAGSSSGITANSGVLIKNAGNSAIAFQIQNTATNALFTADTSSMIITVAGTSTTFGSLTITNAHFKSTQTTSPAIGMTTCVGSQAVTALSTDSAGSFTTGNLTTGGSCVLTITFNKPYGAAPKSVIITPMSSTAPAANAYVSSTSTTTFIVTFNTSVPTSQTDSYYYWVVE